MCEFECDTGCESVSYDSDAFDFELDYEIEYGIEGETDCEEEDEHAEEIDVQIEKVNADEEGGIHNHEIATSDVKNDWRGLFKLKNL